MIRVGDRHLLARIEDSASFLYVDDARVEQRHNAIALLDGTGRVEVPCAALAVLLLGPGTSITHQAVKNLADCGCSICWTGEHAVRTYAAGTPGERSARNLLRQAALLSDPAQRQRVVRRMYAMRFDDEPPGDDLTLGQIRGLEGVRMREAYAQASARTGVPWSGRRYRRDSWEEADDVNRALSHANSCLCGVCHSAVIAAGYSPALGFIHTGKQLSFVYDVADLYKTETSIPAAFEAVADSEWPLEAQVRRALRDRFAETQVLSHIVSNLHDLLAGVSEEELSLRLWDPDGDVAGGTNYR